MSSADLAAAGRALAAGQLVILPTETVYGLAADAADPAAVARLYEAKGRPSFNPLIAHVADLAMENVPCRRVGCAGRWLFSGAGVLARTPDRLVAPVRDAALVCDLARAGLDTVAVRAPGHEIAQAVIAAVGRPVVAPSANRSGRPSPTTFADAVAETGAAASAALDGGACRIGLESTVVSCLDGPVRLLRPGAVHARRDRKPLIGPLAEGGRRRRALPRPPGASLRAGSLRCGSTRDAPHVPAKIYLSASGAPAGRGRRHCAQRGRRPARGGRAPVLGPARGGRPLPRRDPRVAPIPDEGLGEAINDRLRRAAGYVG